MTKKVKTSAGEFTPNDRCHLGTGGEASVYEHKGLAVKLYTDPAKMVPAKKIDELMQINDPRVIRPNGFAYGVPGGQLLGYTMPLVDPADCVNICMLFTPIFKKDKGLDLQAQLEIIGDLRNVVQSVHDANCLVVDLNELNILVWRLKETRLIDTDSFQTPSFPVDTIMESIRDFSVKKKESSPGSGRWAWEWSNGSDWFSWGVIAFQVLLGLHPFKGGHPRYKMREWSKRMQDNVSVFDKDAVLPAAAPPLNTIPRRLRGWFEDTFQKGQRSMPPDPHATAPAAVPPQIVIRSSGKFKVTEIHNYGEEILDISSFMGVRHVLTRTALYHGVRKIADRHVGLHSDLLSRKGTEARVIPAHGGDSAEVFWDGGSRPGSVFVYAGGRYLDTIGAHGLFARHGCAYTIGSNEKVIEISVDKLGNGKIIASTKNRDDVIGRSARIFDGVVVQPMLGKVSVILPYQPGASVNRLLPELVGYRIVDAKAVWPTLVVVGEKAGKFDRFVFGFKDPRAEPKVRKDEDVSYGGLNLTVNSTGICVMLLSDTELGLCKATDPTQAQIVPSPPIDSSMTLFSDATGTFFVNGSSVFKIELI